MGRDGLLGPVVGTEVLILKRCWTAKDRVKLEPDSFEYMTCCGCGRHVERFDEKRKLALKRGWLQRSQSQEGCHWSQLNSTCRVLVRSCEVGNACGARQWWCL